MFHEKAGMINFYQCRSCCNGTFYILLADGITPFLIDCPRCTEAFNAASEADKEKISRNFDYGLAQSASYVLHLHGKVKATHCFYRPSHNYFQVVCEKPHNREHVLRGGLLYTTLELGLRHNAVLTFDDLDFLKRFYE